MAESGYTMWSSVESIKRLVARLFQRNSSNPPERVKVGPLEAELQRSNALARQEARHLLAEKGDCLPNCDLSVWLRDCQSDIDTPLSPIHVTGELPAWLEGTLVRNGPGRQSFGEDNFLHLFDCSAVLHRFHMKEGRCTYQNKLLKSETFKKNKAANRIVVSEFGTGVSPDPCHTIFHKVKAVLTRPQTDNCMISVYPWGDQLFAMTETTVMYRVDPATLDTLSQEDMTARMGLVHHSSHPHVTEDGTVYNLGLSVGPLGPKYTVVKFTPGEDMFERGEVVCSVKARWPLNPSYMHSFGMTARYFVIIEQPLVVSVAAVFAARISLTASASHPILRWQPDHPTLVHVVDRESGVKRTYRTERLFYLHVINQFEEGDSVVVDLCAYRDAAMIDCMYLEALREAHSEPEFASKFRGRPVRLRLPLKEDGALSGAWPAVLPDILCDMGCETPRIPYPDLLGKPYTYFYGIASDVDLLTPGTLIKVDTVRRTKVTWSEEGTFPSEPIFVARKERKAEDDGVVVSALLWCEDPHKVSLLVLDATSFTELARTTFRTPCPVPKCLHGWFLPAETGSHPSVSNHKDVSIK